ncbi:MAG: phosphohistidine phosphatase SixA [Opitutaceae bacterium]|nr:phosphohistidine phosphatase SixA [Opitutaceae bacterium]
MQLYLIRHADAVDSSPDAERPLSARGREQVRTLAKFLGRSDAFAPREIWHSSLVRARETAELLVRGLKSRPPCRPTAGLEPEADPQLVARKAGSLMNDIALVGHQPHLGLLASFLVAGTIARPVVVMKKCTVLALEREGSNWVVRWQLARELLE